MKSIKKSAFTLIEIVVVLFLVVVVVPAINNVMSQSIRSMAHTQRETEALYLAQEGMEVVRAVRDNDWTAEFSFTTPDPVTKYINDISGPIALEDTPSLIDNRYTRTVVISPICRDVNKDIIACGSGQDENSKQIDVTVSWGDLGGTKTISLSTYLTNFQGDTD